MKKVILFLILPLLFFSCELEEEDPRVYDGVWVLDSVITQTLTLSRGDFTVVSIIDYKGVVTDVDADTFTFRYTHIGSGGQWFTFAEAGQTQPDDVTKNWSLSPGGNILTLTDPNGVEADEVYTKQ